MANGIRGTVSSVENLQDNVDINEPAGIRGTVTAVQNIDEMVCIDDNGAPITGTLSSQQLRVQVGGILLATLTEGEIDAAVAAYLEANPINVGFWIVSSTEPTLRTDGEALEEGDAWIDTSTDELKIYLYDGTTFAVASGGASVDIAATPPTDATQGDVWVDCDTGVEYVYWTDTGPWVQTGGIGYESAGTSGGDDIDLSGIAAGSLVKVNATQNGFVLAIDGTDYNVGSGASEVLTKITAIATVSNDGTLAYPPSAFSSGGVALSDISPAHILTYNGFTLNGTIDYNFVQSSIVLTATAEAALTDGEQLVLIDFSTTQPEDLNKSTATATISNDGTLTYPPSAFSTGGVALTEILTTHILTYNGLTLNETIDYNLTDGDIVLTTGAEAALTDGEQLVLITITQSTGA